MTAFDTLADEDQAEDTEADQLTVADGEQLWVQVQAWAAQVTC